MRSPVRSSARPETRYCIWHIYRNQVAVNLGGQKLENMSREDADQLMNLIHPDIRGMVEVRQMQVAVVDDPHVN